MHTVAMVGQFLIGLFFVVMAIYNYTNRKHFMESLKAKHVNIPEMGLNGLVLLELVGGLLVIVDYAQYFAAIYLIAFTLIVSYILHPFWKSKGHDLWKQMVVVMGNLAVIGGLLLLMAMHRC